MKTTISLEDVLTDKRVLISMRLSRKVAKTLEEIIKRENIVTEDDRPYSIRWFIEDMVIWVLSDEERLRQFLDEMYEVEEVEEEG